MITPRKGIVRVRYDKKYEFPVRVQERSGRPIGGDDWATNGWKGFESMFDFYEVSTEARRSVLAFFEEALLGQKDASPAPAKGKQDFDGLIDGVGYKQSMDDNSKAVLSLVPPTQRRGVARVLMFGEKKYARGQWMRGMSWCEVMDAMQRHIDAFMLGEDNDPESGLPHLDHAACCQAFMSWYTSGPRREEYARFDDRLFNRKDPRSDAA